MLTTDDREEIKRLVAEVLEQRAELVVQVFEALRLSSKDVREVNPDSLVDVAARAIEVFGSRDKAMHWLRTRVAVLDDRTPLSLLNTPDGLLRVLDALGQIEHGVW